MAGSASALFLWTLDLTTRTREAFPWLIALLPVGGLFVVFLYTRYGKGAERGNNLIIEEIHEPKKHIPFRLFPLVYFGTLITHLFGGSAGREGTAVQMAGALADLWAHFMKKFRVDRQTLLMMGMSAGFSSVFGTPLAGAVFGMEVLTMGHLRLQALLPCLLSAIVAHWACLGWGIEHSLYKITEIPPLSANTLSLTLFAGMLFGFCAWIFSNSLHVATRRLQHFIASPYLRVIAGAALIIALALILQTDRFLGLGIPQIQQSFITKSGPFDFALKILFTVMTLSVGFKGGEVTPLFFIGATLGSFLSSYMGLPTDLLAGMGFVAVFAGAANVPLASALMAIELFGAGPGVYMALACFTSFLFSGHVGIYSAQKIEVEKYANKN